MVRRYALVDSERRFAVSTDRQLVIVDVKTLAPLGMLRAAAYERMEAIAETSLFVARTSGERVTIYDANPLSSVVELGHVKMAVSPDGTLFSIKATSSACSGPFALTFDREVKRLAVGTAHGMCIFQVPSLRFVGRVELEDGVRDAPDGWDRVVPSFVGGDRVIFAGRRDGVAALIDAATLTRSWSGRGRLVRVGSREVIDNGSSAINEIGPSGQVIVHEATNEDRITLARADALVTGQPGPAARRLLDRAFCSVDDWLLPGPCP